MNDGRRGILGLLQFFITFTPDFDEDKVIFSKKREMEGSGRRNRTSVKVLLKAVKLLNGRELGY